MTLGVALLTTFALLFANSATASAKDFGGNGDPSGCAGYTAKSTPIYGQRGPTIGKVIGQLEIRWSWSCYGNWSRVVLYGGMYSNTVTVEQTIESEGRGAGSNDFVRPGTSGTTAWTPYLRLQNSQSQACAKAWLSSDFGTPNFHTVGAELCA